MIGTAGPSTKTRWCRSSSTAAFGAGGAAPSIDTAMHALRRGPSRRPPAPGCGDRHGRGTPTARRHVKECFGREVAWVPWRRPGFELGLQIAALHRDNPGLRGVVLGGHGLTTWGDTSDECERTSLGGDPPGGAVHRRERWARIRSARSGTASSRCRTRSAATWRRSSRRCSAGCARAIGARSGRYDDRRPRARLPRRGGGAPPRPARARRAPTTSSGPRSARCSSTCRLSEGLDVVTNRLRELHVRLPGRLRGLLRAGTPQPGSPPMRGADPAIVLVPGVGMFSFGRDAARGPRRGGVLRQRDQRDAGRRGALRLRADRRGREVPHRVLGARGGEAAPTPAAEAAGRPGGARDRGVRPASGGPPRSVWPRRARRWSLPTSTVDARRRWWTRSGGRDHAAAVEVDVTDEVAVAAALAAASVCFGGVDLVVNNAGLSVSKPLLETSAADWDRQHDVMARGSFLVSREAARVMVAPGAVGRHRLHRVEERGRGRAGQHRLRRGQGRPGPPGAAARGRARRPLGVRVNGVNPDGVVRGSGIFAGGLGRGAGQGLRRGARGARSLLRRRGRCSARRSSPSTSPRPCSRCAAAISP